MSHQTNPTYYVSRQQPYYANMGSDDPVYTVEVSEGYPGWDYAGADMLGCLYPHLGEGRDYADPREAVEVALTLMKRWQADRPSYAPYISLSYGNTLGIFTELEPGADEEDARAWAEKCYQKLAKCHFCEAILGSNGRTFFRSFDEEVYCDPTHEWLDTHDEEEEEWQESEEEGETVTPEDVTAGYCKEWGREIQFDEQGRIISPLRESDEEKEDGNV